MLSPGDVVARTVTFELGLETNRLWLFLSCQVPRTFIDSLLLLRSEIFGYRLLSSVRSITDSSMICVHTPRKNLRSHRSIIKSENLIFGYVSDREYYLVVTQFGAVGME